MENDFNSNEERIELPQYDKKVVPPGLEDKTVQSLKNKGLIGSANVKNRVVRIAVSVLLVAAVFYTGWIVGKNDKTKSSVVASNNAGGNDYLLLLYNTPGFVESKAHVKEYGDWMRSLIKNKHLASGEELKKEGWQISVPDNEFRVENHPVMSDKGRISGFFLVKAEDEKKALEIALSCPHVKHKGMIELRPVRSH